MLTRKNTPQINVDDDKLGRIQQNIADTLDPVLATPILDGVHMQRQTIPATLKLSLGHGLGRPALGYFITYANQPVPPPFALLADQTNPAGALVLSFSSGAGATISVWIF